MSIKSQSLNINELILWDENARFPDKYYNSDEKEMINYFLSNTKFELKRFSSGAGVPTLNRNFVHDEIVFSTNNIELQKKIVNQLNDLKSEIKEIESQYQ